MLDLVVIRSKGDQALFGGFTTKSDERTFGSTG